MANKEEDSLVVTLAENHVTQYALNRVLEPTEGHSNDLTAALVCRCPSCVSGYFVSLDWLTQNTRISDGIAASHGLSRVKLKPYRRQR